MDGAACGAAATICHRGGERSVTQNIPQLLRMLIVVHVPIVRSHELHPQRETMSRSLYRPYGERPFARGYCDETNAYEGPRVETWVETTRDWTKTKKRKSAGKRCKIATPPNPFTS
jgi:hypothetical protein